MSGYYNTIVFFTIATMIISVIHMFENQTLPRGVKIKLSYIAILIAVGTTCEAIGIFFGALPDVSIYVHRIVKAIEFSIAPVIPIIYVFIVSYKSLRTWVKKISIALIVVNTFFEMVSIIIPIVFYVDEKNYYHHGQFYFIYILMYVLGVTIFIEELTRYSKKYQIRNIATFIAMMIFLVLGLSIRIIDSSIHTDWHVVSIVYFIFIIYYSDLSLKVDALTDLLNRKSYELQLKRLDYATAIIILDVNDFKNINDNYGHHVGDKVLKVIARTIMEEYGEYGYCYRIGGDEFCVILKDGVIDSNILNKSNIIPSSLLDLLNSNFDESIVRKIEQYPMLESGVSKGYAIFGGLYDHSVAEDEKKAYTLSSVKEVVCLADERMYEDKKKYHDSLNRR